MSSKQQKRKYCSLESEEKEDKGEENGEVEPEVCLPESITCSIDSVDDISREFTNQLEQESELDSQDMDDNLNQLSTSLDLTEVMNSLGSDNPVVSSAQSKRARIIFQDTDHDFSDLVLPPFTIPLCHPPAQSPSSSTDVHSSSVGLTDSSNSLNSDNSFEENSLGPDVDLDVHEVIDLSSPVLRGGSSDVVDLTLEPNSPTRNNFVDLTSEAVEHFDAVIVGVNKIYERRSVIQPRPSCRFEVTPSGSSSNQDSGIEITGQNSTIIDDDVRIENVTIESDESKTLSNNGASSSSGGNKNEDKEQFQKSITCPICLDDANFIKRKRQLSSTTCGHVFCDKCIKNAVKRQNKCPTCRKKLTMSQIHPLFL